MNFQPWPKISLASNSQFKYLDAVITPFGKMWDHKGSWLCIKGYWLGNSNYFFGKSFGMMYCLATIYTIQMINEQTDEYNIIPSAGLLVRSDKNEQSGIADLSVDDEHRHLACGAGIVVFACVENLLRLKLRSVHTLHTNLPKDLTSISNYQQCKNSWKGKVQHLLQCFRSKTNSKPKVLLQSQKWHLIGKS